MKRLVASNPNQRSDSNSPSKVVVSGGFYGNYAHTVDEKGRVSLPAEFRRVLDAHSSNSVILTNYVSDGARCIEGFTRGSWDQFESSLREKSRFSAQLHKLENFYLSRAAECPVDSNGRILIPGHLRAYAALQKDVTFTASLHGFRVWDTRVWENIFSSAEQALLDNPEIFADVDV